MFIPPLPPRIPSLFPHPWIRNEPIPADRVELGQLTPSPEVAHLPCGPATNQHVAGWMRAGLLASIPLGGTPVGLSVAQLGWEETATREAQQHLLDRGLHEHACIRELVLKELEIGTSLDSRVSPLDMLNAIDRAAAAQDLQPQAQSALFGFTRLTDAKLEITGEVFGQLKAQARPDGPELALLERLGQHLHHGKGASLQINLDDQTGPWLSQALAQAQVPVREAMGGAGIFCAGLASAQPNVQSSFWNLGGLPPRIGAGTPSQVTIYDELGQARSPQDSADPRVPDRINYIAEYRQGGEFEGTRLPNSGRVILSTPGTQEIGFGKASSEVLSKVIEGKNLLFFAGAHYLTKGDLQQATDLANQLAVMKAANPACTFHLQYVIPKDPSKEAELFSRLAAQVDSMSLNSVEVPGLMERLSAASMTDYQGPSSSASREEMESPAPMLDGALNLQETLGLKRLHLHGLHGDLVISQTPSDCERTVLALLKARQIASMKAANPSGEVKHAPTEMWPVLPVVEGFGLAAVQKFADAVQERYHLTPAQRDQVARDWYFDDGKGQTLFFVPNRGIHDRTGGTVSLGDTIDSMALIYAYSQGKPS